MSPIHIGMSIFVVAMQVLCRQPYCWDFMGAASLACQEDTILQQASSSPGSYHPSCFFTFEGIKAFSGRMQIVLHWVSVCSTMEDHICLDRLSFKASFLLSHFTWNPQSFLLWEAFARPPRFPFRLQMEELLAVVIACKQDRDEGREDSRRGGQAAYLPGSLVSFFAQ